MQSIYSLQTSKFRARSQERSGLDGGKVGRVGGGINSESVKNICARKIRRRCYLPLTLPSRRRAR